MDKHRKIIKESHERSKEYGVDKSDMFSKKILDDKYLRRLFSKNDSLLSISDEFIDYLFYSLKDTGFIVILTDSEGCILRIKGDESITEEARKLNMVEGAYMDEKSIGTNAMGTALRNDKPIQITADEHFISVFHRWTCSAAPIHHQDEIIGSLNLTGFKDKVHPHTLSLVLAAVRAIENKLESNEIAHKLFDAQQFAFSMMNHLSFGVFAINLNDDVQWVNDTACRILDIKRSKLIQMPFDDLLPDWKRIKRILLHELNFEDEELSFKNTRIQQTFHFNAYTIHADKHDILGFLVTFRSMKRTMNMLKKVSGMQARYTFDNLQADSHQMLDVISYGKKISMTNSSVLIMGESGTGKEIIAQSIHNASERDNNPFVAVNCGAISSSLIESELFGYEEGAFTGALKGGRPGKFEMAGGGTLFLDEIGEMPVSMQVKLLRALQEGAITRVGAQKEIKGRCPHYFGYQQKSIQGSRSWKF
ncbi:MAG: sigma 54-interacting transcriptional regulator [Bacteroidales bacterium]|nr:sigma 54-interacting transcriptional regulator [Bacteroidales bacterium]